MIVMASSGISMDVVSLDLDDACGRGGLTVRIPDRATLMAVVAHLDGGGVLGGIEGGARFLVLDENIDVPSIFPTEVTLRVIEREMPDYAPRFRMSFGNHFLQSGCWVNVISFEPPAEDGSTEGVLRAHCETPEDYRELRRFTDEPHGSALRSTEGPMWFVERIADDGNETRSFPQVVTFRLRWHRTE